MGLFSWLKTSCYSNIYNVDFDVNPRQTHQSVPSMFFRNIGSPHYYRHENADESVITNNYEARYVSKNTQTEDYNNNQVSEQLEEKNESLEDVYIDDDYSNAKELPVNLLLSSNFNSQISSNAFETFFDETQIMSNSRLSEIFHNHSMMEPNLSRLTEIFQQHSFMERDEMQGGYKRSMVTCFIEDLSGEEED